MGQIDTATSKFNAFVAAVTASPLFHAALPFIAAGIVASEHKWPSVKQDIAGGLLLLTSIGRVLGPIMDFVKPADDSAKKPR